MKYKPNSSVNVVDSFRTLRCSDTEISLFHEHAIAERDARRLSARLLSRQPYKEASLVRKNDVLLASSGDLDPNDKLGQKE
jgi:hypothetical protein